MGAVLVEMSNDKRDEEMFDEHEMDKVIRQIVDKVRGNYLQNGAAGRGIPSEVKRIIETNIDRI